MGEIVTQDVGGQRLTEAQERLIDAISGISETGEPLDMVAAGYDTAQKLGNATRSGAVQAELKTRRVARIKTTLAAKALKAMETLLESEKTPSATKFSVARWVLEQAGHTESQADAKDKPLHEMTESELLAFMAKAQKVVDQGGDAPIIAVTP